MPLSRGPGVDTHAVALDEMLLSALHRSGQYRVLGPADLNAMLGAEQLKDALGCDDVACAAEIGGALGARWMVAGALAPLADQVLLSLRLLDTEASAVLSRAAIRAHPNAEGLATMTSRAVAELLGETSKGPAAAAVNTYQPFQEALQQLQKQMARQAYSDLLRTLDDKPLSQMSTPPGTDGAELEVYYRALACAMLKREVCLREQAARYAQTWPQGTYGPSISSWVTQLDDAAFRRTDQENTLRDRLTEIRRLRQRGHIDDLEAMEQMAYAYFSVGAYDQAGAFFKKVLARLGRRDPNKAMRLVQTLTLALRESGQFDAARKLLERLQREHPRAFRRYGLHHQLQQLPR